MVSFKMCFYLILLLSETEIELNNRLLSNKEIIFRRLNRLPFWAPRFQLTSLFEIYGYAGLCVLQII